MSTRSDGSPTPFWGDADDDVALERFRTLVDAVDDGIYQLDPDGHFVAVNDAFLERTGYAREELLGAHVSVLYPEADCAEGAPEGRLSRAADRGSTADVGWRVRADGSRFRVDATTTAISDGGELAGYAVVVRDVIGRRPPERGLDGDAGVVLERVSDAFYAVDEDFRFTYVNERAAELLQCPADELLGRRLWDVFPSAAEIDEVWEAFQTARDDQVTTSYELYYDELEFWVEATLYPSDSGISVYFRDVTERRERERQLEEFRQWNRTLMEHFPNGAIALVDRDVRYVTFGGTPEGDTALTEEEPEGEPVEEALPERLAEVVVPRYEAALAGEGSEFEATIDGRTYQFHFVPVRDDDGDVFAAAAISQEITEHKEREQQLRETKLQLEAATEAGAVGTWEWHVPEDEFVTGDSFAKTFGVDPEAAREGVPIERLMASIHDDDRDRVADQIDEAVENCGEYEAEYRVWNADGELRWVVARGHVECDEDGNAVTFPGALTDITERKEAELELERQRRELEILFDVLPVGVVVAGADGSLLRANDTAKEIWGGDVFDAESVAEYEKYRATWADGDEPVEPEDWTMSQVVDGEAVTEPNVYEIDTFDGKRRIIMEHGMPVRDASGNVSRAVVTLTDVSERKEYERKLEESNERLEQFAYAASHDLQEPLRMVTSYLQLIERRYADDLDDEAEEFIEYAVDGAERMRQMIQGLLEYSRVETRGDPFEPVDLDGLLEEVRDDLRIRIEESDAEIASTDLPTVEGDASQLRQVFQNLLENAIEYSGEERPVVRVDAERRRGRWLVSVADEGIGIDPDDADRVFDVFQRLHTNEEVQGTGIGLALCKRIVERHGGDVWVDSEPGEGSTFHLTLPAASADPAD